MAKRTKPPSSKARPRASTERRSGAATKPTSSTKVSTPQAEPDASPMLDELVSTELQAIFGENLRAARLKRGLKQSEMAERTGFSQQRLSMIEIGHQNLTLKSMTKLAHVVGHDVIAMLQKMNIDNDTD